MIENSFVYRSTIEYRFTEYERWENTGALVQERRDPHRTSSSDKFTGANNDEIRLDAAGQKTDNAQPGRFMT